VLREGRESELGTEGTADVGHMALIEVGGRSAVVLVGSNTQAIFSEDKKEGDGRHERGGGGKNDRITTNTHL